MLNFRKSAFCGLTAALAIAATGFDHCALAQRTDNPDYSLGKPRIWIYQRVYPFLDGIFQDVSSTAVAPLMLNSYGANASQVNAVESSWGLGLTYSSTAEAQNLLAQQQSQLMIANTQLQSQLLSQQSQITQQLLTATQQQGQAQEALAQLTSQASPSSAQLATAQSAVAAANANVTSLTSQLALVKAQMPSTAPSFNAPAASQPSSVTVPSQLSGLTAPPSAPSPNFPASKQMDNQVNLLWERLSRLVSTLAQADSLHDYRLVLAGFDVNLMPNRENKKVFAAEYKVTAVVQEEQPDGTFLRGACDMTPLVVDMFPSASAVNIVDNRYRDTRGAIGAVLSWLGFGLNAAYNRDHLQMTQALGQSAYITGYGAGTDTFGWAFGRNLGDTSVSPGKRTVFAIIAVPEECPLVRIESIRAGWFAERSDDWYSRDAKAARRFGISASRKVSITGPVDGTDETPKVLAVAYTPIEFDPAAAAPMVSSLRIDFEGDIDPQIAISVNGQIVPRARDTFARGVQNAGGSGGLLESSSFTVNTWIATSSHSITISLDPSKFTRDFPDVVFITPKKIRALNESDLLPKFNKDGNLKSDDNSNRRGVHYSVAGARFGCADPCHSNIPPLGFRKATWQTLSAFHRDPVSANTPTTVVLSLPSDVSNTSASSPASGNLQVLAAAPSPWGGNVLVMASLQSAGEDAPQLIRLACRPISGTVRLICTFPLALTSSLGSPVTIEVHDSDHAGGTVVSARATLDPHSGTEPFIVWSISQPQWVIGDSAGNQVPALLICAAFMNAQNSDKFVLGLANGTPGSGIDFQFRTNESSCHKEPGQWTGGVRLTLDEFISLTDQMTIIHEDSAGGVADTPATLLNLHAAGQPVVYASSTDNLEFYGQNLVFGDQLQIGTTGKPVPIACDRLGSSCQVNPPPPPANSKALPPPLGLQGGPVYMVYTNQSKHSALIPIMKNTSGVVSALQYVPPAPSGGGNGGGGGNGNGQASFNMTISANSGGAANPPSPGQQPATGIAQGASSGGNQGPTPTAAPPTSPGSSPAGVSPMSVIVSQ